MERIESVEVYTPDWIQGRSLDERQFCQDFLALYPMKYVDGEFFSEEGWVPEGKVRQYMYQYLEPYVSTGFSKKLTGLMDVLRLQARQDTLEHSECVLHCANGELNVFSGEFTDRKVICRHRLPVRYNPAAEEPKLWKAFLEDLLEEEDIRTLQEYLGYCLLPINYAQKMLLIIGRGGEGKSRIGIMLHHLLGNNMCNGSLAKVEGSPFARADLQHRLVMVDDDLRLEALTSTHHIKSLITAEQEMDLEKKGLQSYQATIRCRFLAFGNGNLRSLHDRSHGFFRRQLILSTKERPRDRVDDPLLAQRLRQELEGILLWCLEGLRRFLEQDMRFTVSRRTRCNILEAMAEGNNVTDFMRSKGYFRHDAHRQISSRKLYSLYREWCDDNMLTPLTAKSFSAQLIQSQNQYGLRYSTHIDGGDGREVRGFVGICGHGRY